MRKKLMKTKIMAMALAAALGVGLLWKDAST